MCLTLASVATRNPVFGVSAQLRGCRVTEYKPSEQNRTELNLVGELHHLCSENKSVENAQPICAFVKTVLSLDAAYNQFYFGSAVCSSCLNFAYCAIRYVTSGECVDRINSFKLLASGRFQ